MPKNHIQLVENFLDERRKGFPNGVSETYQYIPALLARIEELERAMIPFGRVYLQAISNREETKPVAYANMNDFKAAYEVLDSGNSQVRKTEASFFSQPAE
jgi:hypothetical protein